MAYYTVYWPKDWLDELRKSDDNGPIKVVFDSRLHKLIEASERGNMIGDWHDCGRLLNY